MEKVSYNKFANILGEYSYNDGTIDFYSRVKFLLEPDMIILDLGAGRASWYEDDVNKYRKSLRTLKGHVKKVIAVDVDKAVLRNNSVDKSLLMRGYTIPLKDNSIDIVISDYVLEHIDNPIEYYNEVNRVLKTNGWFCARTPHKYSYVSLFARLVANKYHSRLLRFVQPDRKNIDIFPTRYRLNTLSDVLRIFKGFKSSSFIFRPDPSYYFGNKYLYELIDFLHRIMPIFMCGNLFIFLRKEK